MDLVVAGRANAELASALGAAAVAAPENNPDAILRAGAGKAFGTLRAA